MRCLFLLLNVCRYPDTKYRPDLSGIDTCYQPSSSPMVPEFTQIDSLPGPKVQAPVCYGDGHRLSGKGRFNVCRHIVGPFKCMDIMPGAFGNELVENCFKVNAHRGIGVFVDRQSGRCVLNKKMQQSCLRKVIQLIFDEVGYQVKPTWIGRKEYVYLPYHKKKGSCKDPD